MPVAIRAWDGFQWVPPRYNVGTAVAPEWREYGDAGSAFVVHMDDTFGGDGDSEWIDTLSGTTPEGDGYIYREMPGTNRLADVLQPPPAAGNVGKTAQVQVIARAELISGATSLAGCFFKFEVWDTFADTGTKLFDYQTGSFAGITDTNWVTYRPFDMYTVAAGVPEFHRVLLVGPTSGMTTRVSLSRWTVMDTATDAVMGTDSAAQAEVTPQFWDGTAWIPQTME